MPSRQNLAGANARFGASPSMPVPQNALVKFVRNAPPCLRWFRSDLTRTHEYVATTTTRYWVIELNTLPTTIVFHKTTYWIIQLTTYSIIPNTHISDSVLLLWTIFYYVIFVFMLHISFFFFFCRSCSCANFSFWLGYISYFYSFRSRMYSSSSPQTNK